MTENPWPENMGCNNLRLCNEASDWSSKSDDRSFGMDMDIHCFPPKEINVNSRITLQRNVSRKGSSEKGGEKKMKSTTDETDSNMLPTSPKATFHGGSCTPEKPSLVEVGATDHSIFIPQLIHHQTTTSSGGAAAGNNYGGKRISFRRSSPSSIFNSTRILFLFASLSSMGTILLIYFTLSMNDFN